MKNTTSNGTIIVDEEQDEDRALEREVEERERVAAKIDVTSWPATMKNVTTKLLNRYDDTWPCVHACE